MEQVLNPGKEQSELDVMVWGGNRAVSKAMALVSWAAAGWHLRDMIEAITAEQNSHRFWSICPKWVWCIQHPSSLGQSTDPAPSRTQLTGTQPFPATWHYFPR